MSDWEDELREFFPAYFLAAAGIAAMSLDEVERFLERLGIPQGSLTSFLDASVLAKIPQEVRRFTLALKSVASVIPSRTELVRIENNGVARGRVDVRRTLQARIGGRPTTVVSQVPRRRFDIPENVLLVATAKRVAQLLTSLAARRVIPSKSGKKGWGVGLLDCADTIARTLEQAPFAEIPIEPIDAIHVWAARQSPHVAHHVALELYLALEAARDPSQLARIIAEGALAPVGRERRFELAVLIRLVRCLESRLEKVGFALTQRLVEKGRREVFEFATKRKQILMYLDQAVLTPRGSREEGLRHYFGGGRRRPDITLEFLLDGQRTHAVVIEAKESSNEDYLRQGFQEAILYRVDHGDHLPVWPGAILVVSMSELRRKPLVEHSVVAVGWKDWVPAPVLDSLLGQFLAA